jgi:lysophospholipase L1-like esterase
MLKRFLKSRLVLSLAAFIMIGAAVFLPLSGFQPHAHAASRSSLNIAYVNYDDSGFTESGIPSANIFSNSIVGGPSPTSSPTDSVTYNGMTFTPLSRTLLSTSTLAPFDTLILFELCDIGTSFSSAQHDAINAFLAAGNKILLYDADRCAPGEGGTADYSWFTYPFATSNPGPKGASGTLTIVENSTLTQGLANDPFSSDELGDANTATTSDPHWFAAAKTTNALGVNGYFLAYARNKGLIIYDGADHWYTDSPTQSLTDLFLNELNQQYDPDNLPGTTPIAQTDYVAFGDSLTTGYSIPTCKANLGTSPWNCNGTRPATPYADKVAKALGYSYSDDPSVYLSAAPNLPAVQLARVGIWGYTAQQAASDYTKSKDSSGPWDTQLDAITKAHSLVTGELGVNDLHFSDVGSWSKPMLEDSELGTNRVTTDAQNILKSKAVSSALDTLFAKLKIAKANGARVVITLVYNPYGSNFFHPCHPLHDGAAELVNALDSVLKARAIADGLLVADFRPAFNGHGAGDSNPYTFGADCSIGSALWDWVPTWLGNNRSVNAANKNVDAKFDPHPNDLGTSAMATAILEALK